MPVDNGCRAPLDVERIRLRFRAKGGKFSTTSTAGTVAPLIVTVRAGFNPASLCCNARKKLSLANCMNTSL